MRALDGVGDLVGRAGKPVEERDELGPERPERRRRERIRRVVVEQLLDEPVR